MWSTMRPVLPVTAGVHGPRTAASPAWFISALYSLLASIGMLLAVWENGDRAVDHFQATFTTGAGGGNSPNADTYDFIIVGGGTAGLVVATRLSENPNWRVLVLEAGGEPHPLHRIPMVAFGLANYPQTDWQYKTVPQKNSSFAREKQQVLWSAGKSLGGSSNLNYLMYLRGNPKDFDNWARATGDPSWKYEKVREYFKKIEDYEGNWYFRREHGLGGPVHVQQADYKLLAHEYVQAAKEFGYPNMDLNGNFTEGFDTISFALKNGRRVGTYWSYFEKVRTRPNLIVHKYAYVKKILFRTESTSIEANPYAHAHGVEYDRHGAKRYAFAKREVILSAGTVQSPKILMLSGIGPRKHLESLRIPVVLDHPRVGKNIQDHVGTLVGPFEIKSKSSHIAVPNIDQDMSPAIAYEYLTKGKGLLASPGITASGLVASSFAKARGEAGWPDTQYFMLAIGAHKTFGKDYARCLGLDPVLMTEYYRHAIHKNVFQQLVVLTRPKSRGEITLRKNDPYADVAIDPKYFDDGEDMRTLVEGIQRAVSLVENSTVFSKLGASFTTTALRGCESVPFKSAEYFECYARTFTFTVFHGAGSCSMGKNDSRSAVVDSQLRVIGVKGLRVIDASIMPFVTVANTQAPTIMIGEKGADLIKKAWPTHRAKPTKGGR